MIIMPANHAGLTVGYLAGRFPGRIGWILSPDGWKIPPPWMPYALDNGAFPVWTKGGAFDEVAFYAHCQRIVGMRHKPLWIAVPDVVANREETIKSWWRHYENVAAFCPRLAFVVQDGMVPADVPENASVVFVGGQQNGNGSRYGLGQRTFRESTLGGSIRIGCFGRRTTADSSCDGTGWFRGDQVQFAGLLSYLSRPPMGALRSKWQCDHW